MTEQLKHDYDTDYTDEIICPYCGCKFMDSWKISADMSDGETVITSCQECDKEFNVLVNIDISYTTWEKERK
ncbi:MAG: hypothetical protein ABIJ97_11660 [Bacteroidota bacterium]